MSGKSLGRLKKVELKAAWLSESGEFTPWLAQEENLRLLGETIGIDLELEAQEKAVGPFRADILCKDTATDNWVVIENQLEKTDHTHLGQILVYAAGLNAVTVVWIAKKFTDEHRAALDWLNERTDEKINFFALEIELWQIGDSPVAPKFNVICQPNDWVRKMKTATNAAEEVSPHRQKQLKFWTAFREYMESKNSFVKCQKPQPYNWINHSIGRAGAHLTSSLSMWNSETGVKSPEIRAELYFDGPTAKLEFDYLLKQKDHIESELGFKMIWHNPDDTVSCRIFSRQDADYLNESLWLSQFEWLRQKLEKMHQVFTPIVKDLKLKVLESEEGIE